MPGATLAVRIERLDQQAQAATAAVALKFSTHDENVSARFDALEKKLDVQTAATHQLVELFKLGNSMLRVIKWGAGFAGFLGAGWAAFKTGTIAGFIAVWGRHG